MGLIGGIARTAVIAGTATAVSNRVSRRQANRWAQEDQSTYAQAPYPPQSAQPVYAQPAYPPPAYAPPRSNPLWPVVAPESASRRSSHTEPDQAHL